MKIFIKTARMALKHTTSILIMFLLTLAIMALLGTQARAEYPDYYRAAVFQRADIDNDSTHIGDGTDYRSYRIENHDGTTGTLYLIDNTATTSVTTSNAAQLDAGGSVDVLVRGKYLHLRSADLDNDSEIINSITRYKQ